MSRLQSQVSNSGLVYLLAIVPAAEILARLRASENVAARSARVVRIANQCPAVDGFQGISATVIELCLVASEVPYIKCVCSRVCGSDRGTDRCAPAQSARLMRCDGSFGWNRPPVVDAY